jgi:hypothetical protein
VTVADVIRAVDGPLVSVYGLRPEAVSYNERADALQRVWIAARHSLRDVFEQVSVADLATGTLPPAVDRLTADDDAGSRTDRSACRPHSASVTHSTNGRSVRQSSRTASSSSVCG